jgi:hypothetical protein
METERRQRQPDSIKKPRDSGSERQPVPDAPPVREEYPGPQETSTGERIDPGRTHARRDSSEERRERRRGAS